MRPATVNVVHEDAVRGDARRTEFFGFRLALGENVVELLLLGFRGNDFVGHDRFLDEIRDDVG